MEYISSFMIIGLLLFAIVDFYFTISGNYIKRNIKPLYTYKSYILLPLGFLLGLIAYYDFYSYLSIYEILGLDLRFFVALLGQFIFLFSILCILHENYKYNISDDKKSNKNDYNDVKNVKNNNMYKLSKYLIYFLLIVTGFPKLLINMYNFQDYQSYIIIIGVILFLILYSVSRFKNK
ncbi:putative membrane protein [Methanococcus voltae]|uniref:Membrane protein n=2 Tax=Methanococcus voltae TaxID=2188 RepID=A0ABT2EVR4_METVO|nr:putative membrane protein [Methanococcus voltae]MBP2201884.1 putative membrane protein [Methanococcus voltae]MCS3922049.1 putative membrane protein [Methanococcus voltae PS]